MSSPTTPIRRGRPPKGTEDERRDRILDAAVAELIDVGASAMTVAAVGRRAHASKETLYRWFGDRDGLLRAVIQRNADRSAAAVSEHLDATEQDPDALVVVLENYGRALLSLLTSPVSVAINRAAMSDPRLGHVLLENGRHRIGPIVETFLARMHNAGVIDLEPLEGPEQAFVVFFGLVVGDIQIRVLLGEEPPDEAALRHQADLGLQRFFALTGPDGGSS